MSAGKVYKDWTSLKPICPTLGEVSKCTLASFGEGAAGAWWSTTQVMGTAGGWGLSTWQQPAHTHGTVLREAGPKGEHFCRKCNCKTCYGEKIRIGGAAKGHFQTSKFPPKERSKNAKKYRGVPGKQMRSALRDVNILPLFLFALFLTKISMIAIETSSGIKSVHPG